MKTKSKYSRVRKQPKMSLAQFRTQMSKHGMSPLASMGDEDEREEWSGSSKGGIWRVKINGDGTCRVSFNGVVSRHDGYENLPYHEACNKIDFHGIHYAD